VLRSKEMALHDKKQILYTLARILKKAQITDQVTVVAKAKVPILKFVTRTVLSYGRRHLDLGHIPVDISINQENGLVAGSVIKRFLAEIPAIRPIVLAIKLFLSQRGINEVFTGGLGSYSVVLLVISFLQVGSLQNSIRLS
jgi:non-canonical poly(A) RNA polymerase PAPD5/7